MIGGGMDFRTQMLIWGYYSSGFYSWIDEIWEHRSSNGTSFGGRITWDQDQSMLDNCFIGDNRCPEWFALPYLAQYAHERGVYAST